MQILLFSGFHPIVYGKPASIATANRFQKKTCPGYRSFINKLGIAFPELL